MCSVSLLASFCFVSFRFMFNFGSMQTKAQTVMSLPDWPSIIGCCHVVRQCVGLAASARWQTNWCQLVMELLLLLLRLMSFPRIDRAVCKVTIKRCSLWQALIKDLWDSFLLRLPDFWFVIRFLFLFLEDFQYFLSVYFPFYLRLIPRTAITNVCLAELCSSRFTRGPSA